MKSKEEYRESRKRYFSDEPYTMPDQKDHLKYDDLDNYERDSIRDEHRLKEHDFELSREFLAEDDGHSDDLSDDFMMQALGWLAIVLSVLAFFTMPILFAAAGIILGFVTRNRGYIWIGNTAIVLSIIALIIQLLIFPFF